MRTVSKVPFWPMALAAAVLLVVPLSAWGACKGDCSGKEDGCSCAAQRCGGCDRLRARVTITVSDDAPVWWGNRGKAFGHYMEFEKAQIQEPRAKRVVRKLKPIYFDLDKSELRPDGIKTADEVLAYLRKHPKARVHIEGNCCDLATNEYNMKLGQRRADAVKQYLVDNGVDPDRIETVTYGEERRVTEDPAERPLNRRADVVVKHKKRPR